MKGSELVDATRFLAASCRLGQPLGEALRLVADPEVADAQASGDTLGQALSKQSQRFGEFYRMVVATAEETQQPGELLEGLAEWLEVKSALDRRLSAALHYPLMVFQLLVLQIILFFGYVLPSVVIPVLEHIHKQAPDPFWFRAMALAVLVAAVVLQSWSLLQPRTFQILPWVKKTRGKAVQSLWLRGLSSLVAAGLPLPEALHKVESLLQRGEAPALRALGQKVGQGSSLEQALDGDTTLEPITRAALTTEESLADALLQAAGILELEVIEDSDRLVALAQPVALILLGVPVALSILSFWLPFYETSYLLGI